MAGEPQAQPAQDSGWIPISAATPTALASAPEANGWQPVNAAPEKETFMPPSVMTPVDVAKGVGEGALKTAVGVGRIMNSPGGNIGMDQVLNKGEELAKPGSQGEQFGQMAEEMAEWAAGDEALKGIVKLASTPKPILELIKAHPVASKIILDTMKGATIGGAQGAVKAAGEGSSATKGAEGGAAGGAVAGAVSGATEETGRIADKKVGRSWGTTSEEDVQKALQFKKNDTAALEDWKRAAPTIGEKFRAAGKPTSDADAFNKIHEAAHEVYNSRVAKPTAQRAGDIPIDITGNPQNQDMIGDEIRKRITPVTKEHFPKRAEVINEIADRWGGHNPKTVGQINAEVTQFNAELGAKGYWESTPEKRAEMEKTDPEVAAYVAAGDELRDILFTHLKATGVPNIDEDRKLYGALTHIGGEVRSRINVNGRRPGMSGKEFIGVVGGALAGGPKGAAVAAAPMIDRAVNEPHKVLARAAEKSLPKTAGKKAAIAVGKGLLKTGEAAVGVAGEETGSEAAGGGDWIKFRGSDGLDYEHHPDESMEDIQAADPGAHYPEVQEIK